MQLSLSVRVAEKYHTKRESAMNLKTLATLSSEAGYSAICIRASQLGIETAVEEISQARRIFDVLNLKVSMVTGDFAIPENSFEGPNALRNITPYLDLAESLGCDLLRICMKIQGDIPWAQRASDEALERGIRLAHQCHAQSLFEQVSDSLDLLRSIGRKNFGIIYEPANLEMCGQDYGIETINKLAPYIFNVYLQNQKLNPDGIDVMKSWTNKPVVVDQIPLWYKGGIDYELIADGLDGIGYYGYVTVHQASTPLHEPAEAIQKSAAYLKDTFRI